MSLPSPKRVQVRLEKVELLADQIQDEYRWAYGVAYPTLRRSGNEGGVAGGRSDPTGGVAVTAQGARYRCRRAWRSISRAVDLLEEARAYLADVTDRGDVSVGEFPKTATRHEIEESRRAQARREARGEGWGEG